MVGVKGFMNEHVKSLFSKAQNRQSLVILGPLFVPIFLVSYVCDYVHIKPIEVLRDCGIEGQMGQLKLIHGPERRTFQSGLGALARSKAHEQAHVQAISLSKNYFN